MNKHTYAVIVQSIGCHTEIEKIFDKTSFDGDPFESAKAAAVAYLKAHPQSSCRIFQLACEVKLGEPVLEFPKGDSPTSGGGEGKKVPRSTSRAVVARSRKRG